MVGTGGAGPLPLGVIPGEALGMLAINYTLIFSVGIYCEISSSNIDEKLNLNVVASLPDGGRFEELLVGDDKW